MAETIWDELRAATADIHPRHASLKKRLVALARAMHSIAEQPVHDLFMLHFQLDRALEELKPDEPTRETLADLLSVLRCDIGRLMDRIILHIMEALDELRTRLV